MAVLTIVPPLMTNAAPVPTPTAMLPLVPTLMTALVAVPRFVEEYIPPHLFSTLSPVFNLAKAIGNLVAVLSGLLLPPDTSSQATLAACTTWYYVFGFPIILLLPVLVLLLFAIPIESPKFYLI